LYHRLDPARERSYYRNVPTNVLSYPEISCKGVTNWIGNDISNHCINRSPA
jgi:hypothetical protein